MHPYWYDVYAQKEKVRCIDCKNLCYNMLAGGFFCKKRCCVIPTREPEDKHVCSDFKNKNAE